MSNVTVVNNRTGLSAASGGHIVSFGNNKVTDNTTNGSPTNIVQSRMRPTQGGQRISQGLHGVRQARKRMQEPPQFSAGRTSILDSR
jgi:hypothetical protein